MSIVLAMKPFPSGQRLEIARGDLTQEALDAIVNAANASLAHGGGVAGAISRAGGPEIQRESSAWVRQHGPVSHQQPAYTGAGRLPCRCVIHAVGPIWGEGDEDAKLAQAVHGSLARAEELGLASIAFPAISTGIFGFPKERAVPIFLETFRQYFLQNPGSGLQQVRMTLMDEDILQMFLQALSAWDALPPSQPGPTP
jgi:O-acetyl-ADP-ribose deacetylase